jgi:hypothetical protein
VLLLQKYTFEDTMPEVKFQVRPRNPLLLHFSSAPHFLPFPTPLILSAA